MRCWDGYWNEPETAFWDCELTTMTSPPTDPYVKEVEADPGAAGDEDVAEVGDAAMFLFEKRYDALSYPPELANALNGTCQKGQLLLRGYEQELSNGKHLRRAYVHSGKAEADGLSDGDDDGDGDGDGAVGGAGAGAGKVSLADSDPRMRLFDLGSNSDMYADRRPYEEPHLYYRADDEQRTLMSGQVLLRGLWGPEIVQDAHATGQDPVVVLHTADYDFDVLTSNIRDCPRLLDLAAEAERSDVFQMFNTSAEAKELRDAASKLGTDFHKDDWIDCLMTTMCTDRPLPPDLADYGSRSSLFQRFIDFATYSHNYKVVHNGAEHAKLGMGPLWHEIMANIRPVVRGESLESGGDPPRLALFSGHDTTLMPLLATLGPKVYDGKEWAPYASVLLIEVHRVDDRSDGAFKGKERTMFRVVYNGRALTSRIEGCPEKGDLCDASVLLDLVAPFAKAVGRDCESKVSPERDGYRSVLATEDGQILIFISMVIISGCVGSVGTFFYLMGRLPSCSFRGRRGGRTGKRIAGKRLHQAIPDGGEVEPVNDLRQSDSELI